MKKIVMSLAFYVAALPAIAVEYMEDMKITSASNYAGCAAFFHEVSSGSTNSGNGKIAELESMMLVLGTKVNQSIYGKDEGLDVMLKEIDSQTVRIQALFKKRDMVALSEEQEKCMTITEQVVHGLKNKQAGN